MDGLYESFIMTSTNTSFFPLTSSELYFSGKSSVTFFRAPGKSSVTFHSFYHHIRERWKVQRYLLLLLPSHLGTLEYPALPFTLSTITFGNAGRSSVPFHTLSIHIRTRWNIQRYLSLFLPSHSGTLEGPALPFTHSTITFGHVGIPSVTSHSFSHHIRERWNFQRYLPLLLPSHSGTLEYPALPFTLSTITFGHVGRSSVPFHTLSIHIRARWKIQRSFSINFLGVKQQPYQKTNFSNRQFLIFHKLRNHYPSCLV